MKLLWIAALAALPTVALAQYKCIAPGGAVTFQQTACPAAQQQQALKIQSTVADVAAPRAKSNDERLLETMQRDRRLKELEHTVANIEADISNRNALMSNEMEAVRSRKALARNNLAGATWEQSLSTEMQAVASKYAAMNSVDIERLKVLRADLDATRKTAAK